MARDGYPLSRRGFLGHAGVLAGGLLQLLYQLPHLKRIGMLVLPR